MVIGQPQAFVAELFAENAILFLQVVDDIALLLVHPAREADEHEPDGVERLHEATKLACGRPTRQRRHHFRPCCNLQSVNYLVE